MKRLATAMTLSAMTTLSGLAAAGAVNAATGPAALADGGFPAGQFSISTGQGNLCLSGEAYTKAFNTGSTTKLPFTNVVRKAMLQTCTGGGSELWTYNAAKQTLVNATAGKGIGQHCIAMIGKKTGGPLGGMPAMLVLRGCTSDWKFLAKKEQDNIVCHQWTADASGHIGCAAGGHRWAVMKTKKGKQLPLVTSGTGDVWKITSVGG
jgi:hypothetical protein